jgi:hypothetical protein
MDIKGFSIEPFLPYVRKGGQRCTLIERLRCVAALGYLIKRREGVGAGTDSANSATRMAC